MPRPPNYYWVAPTTGLGDLEAVFGQRREQRVVATDVHRVEDGALPSGERGPEVLDATRINQLAEVAPAPGSGAGLLAGILRRRR